MWRWDIAEHIGCHPLPALPLDLTARARAYRVWQYLDVCLDQAASGLLKSARHRLRCRSPALSAFSGLDTDLSPPTFNTRLAWLASHFLV